jgi:type I restriction enzyme M protein
LPDRTARQSGDPASSPPSAGAADAGGSIQVDEEEPSEEEPVEGAVTRDEIAALATTGGRGTIIDFISGQEVSATPEEVNATQVFAHRLVEEFGYPKNQIRTRPQFRVRTRPSGSDSYPVDIAVFTTAAQRPEDALIVVECKKPTVIQGRRQLEIYLTMSSAQVGVWFNGDAHLYLRKVIAPEAVEFKQIPTIPRFGQSITEIGRIQRRDLVTPVNLKAIFRDIRNNLAGMAVGATRDEALAREIINILFCKIWDETDKAPEELVSFAADLGDTPEKVRDRIVGLFNSKVKVEFADVFDATDAITLDADSVLYIVGELQNYALTQANREAIGDAFEVFIGPALRGAEGQFFTPRNVVQAMIDFLDPEPEEMLIDPACGSGGFLTVALEHAWKKLELRAQDREWSGETLGRKQRETAQRYLHGIDKDNFLAKVTKAYMAILGDGRGSVFCDNSLARPVDWTPELQADVRLGTFDVVVTNPPFGRKIVVRGEEILGQYDLAKRWRSDAAGDLEATSDSYDRQSPQLLFVERCIQLLKPGGRLGIVLPESIFGMPKYRYVVEFISRHADILAIAAMPEELFQPYTHAKTCLVFLRKRASDETPDDYSILMADARWCGHDSMGNPSIRTNPTTGATILLDDLPTISKRFAALNDDPSRQRIDHLGFRVRRSELINQVLVPRYYDPDLKADLESMKDTHDLVMVSDLVASGALQISTGLEVGKMAYGTGPVPFIRTSDFSNWELKADPKHAVSELIYRALSAKQDVAEHDIFLVRDGTYLVGTSCILTASDTHILFAGGLYKLRAAMPALDPYLMLALLNMPIVKRQFRAKRFTRDIIDTLGRRVYEVVLPMPRDSRERQEIGVAMKRIIETRARLREEGRALVGSPATAADLWDSSELVP